MQDTFNIASLAKLSKDDLQGLLANYQTKLAQPRSEPEQAAIKSKICLIRLALPQA